MTLLRGSACGACILLFALLLLAPAKGASAPLPAPPADLAARFAPVVPYLAPLYGPCATRVLQVREDRLYLEEVPGVQPGDLFAIYPPGTILLGPQATQPRPDALTTIRVMRTTEGVVEALFDGDPTAVPTFAPALRVLTGRALAVVWTPPPAELAPLVEHWRLTHHLYDQLLATVPIPLTSQSPPDALPDQVPSHPALVQLPATEQLLVTPEAGGLLLRWSSAYVDSQPPLRLALPLRDVRLTPLYDALPGSSWAGESLQGAVSYRLPTPICDCTDSAPSAPDDSFWCLTPVSLIRLRLEHARLSVTGHWPLDLPQEPPYGRQGAGLLRWVPSREGDLLLVHRGQGGAGQLWRWTGSTVRWEREFEGIPLPAPHGMDTVSTAQDGSGAGRFHRPAAYATALLSPLRGVVADASVQVGVDGTGTLRLTQPDGTRAETRAGGFSGPVLLTSTMLYAATGQAVMRYPRNAEGRPQDAGQRSVQLPGWPVALWQANDMLWALVTRPGGDQLLVQVPQEGWSAPGRSSQASGWPTPGGVGRLGLATDRLDLTPEGALTPDERRLTSALYDTPAQLLPDGKTWPLAAVQISRNSAGDVWELELQKGLRWPDGSAVTAEALRAGWERTARAHPLGAPAMSLLVGYREFRQGPATGISGIDVIDSSRLRLRLTQPELRFDSYLADPVFALVRGDRKVLQGGGVSVSYRQGTGPFQPVRLQEQTLELARQPGHSAGLPPLTQWRIDLLSRQEAVHRTYLAGRLDVASVPAGEWSTFAVRQDMARQQLSFVSSATLGLLVNPASPRWSRDLPTRQGLLASPNLEALREVTLGGLVAPARGHFADRLGLPAAQAARAAAVTPGPLRVLVPSHHPDLYAAGVRIRTELESKDSRWQVHLVQLPVRDLLTRRPDWDLALWEFGGLPQPVLTEALEFRALWTQWGGAVSPGTPAYGLEAELLRQGWWRPLGHPRQLWLRDPALRGWLGPQQAQPGWAAAWWER
ncbi:MAG: hypothetical protein GEEBNDBF_01132 [bacterium]|nr:hypothetical protein [bacterium]